MNFYIGKPKDFIKRLFNTILIKTPKTLFTELEQQKFLGKHKTPSRAKGNSNKKYKTRKITIPTYNS